jgi:hypothetical protein
VLLFHCVALTRLIFECLRKGNPPSPRASAVAKAMADKMTDKVVERVADRVDWQAEPEVERGSAYLRLFAAIPLSKYRVVSPSIGWYRLVSPSKNKKKGWRLREIHAARSNPAKKRHLPQWNARNA